MSMDPFYRARFTFDITEEQRLRANNLIATHTRKAIFQPILDDLLDLIEKHGDIISGIIMSGKAKPREIIPILNQAEKKAERSVR